MAEYLVVFVEDMPSIGPSEVAYAEVLDNGWVCVQWRDALESESYYPPHVILSVKTPKQEGVAERLSNEVKARIKDYAKNYSKSEEPGTPEDEAVA